MPKAAKCVTEGFSDIATVYSHSGTWNSQSGAQFIVLQGLGYFKSHSGALTLRRLDLALQ